ncbi:hypothetical protein V5799_025548 [Amblyomma americanum]|uniref:RNA-dependent RNA polymerase n=1 Tax=Amblyomma americanum TaxID=6943 RepID=A0AAQ4E987_AMBAM
MITILEQSGIKAEVFLMLQNKILNSFIDKMMDPHEAAHVKTFSFAQVLCVYCALRLPYKERACGCIDLTIEPFFRALVRAVNKKVLKELRTKARILVLSDYGLTMFGVLDETGTLEYGQVFVQYSNDRHATVQGQRPCDHLLRYAMKIRALLKSYRIESESEALCGALSKLSKYVKENDPSDMAMVLESQVEHVVRRTREEFFSEQLDEAHRNLKASALYQRFRWVESDVRMRIVVNTSSFLPVPASRNSFSQRFEALLLLGVPHPGGGDQDGAQHGDTQVLTNLLRFMYKWINSSREFRFVKDPEELGLYKNIVSDACFKCAWCLKIFQGGSDGEVISKECRRHYLLGHLSLITLNRLSMSGNLAYLRRAPEACPCTELISIYIDREDEEFFLILHSYEDIFKMIMMDWSGVQDIQCTSRRSWTSSFYRSWSPGAAGR